MVAVETVPHEDTSSYGIVAVDDTSRVTEIVEKPAGGLSMGRIKSALIKRTANNLLKEENKFEEDFEKNKILLGNSMPSKSTKNKIAGYITRIKRLEREKRAKLEAK